MRESVGKAVAREYLYKNCLPDWLSPEELRTGNYLLLLGSKPRELAYTDLFGASRSQIYSVERASEIYESQLEQKLGIHLWEGELMDFLINLLHGNDDFLVFNLDVEGSYLSQLDAAMTSVLLSSWRNPKTVVATYSSIGRDTEMIWEGIKSLAIFLWIEKKETLKVFSSLIERYKAGRFDTPVSMALRDLFWLRSILEHTLVASSMVGATSPEVVKRWFNKTEILWEEISVWQRRPLRVENILRAMDLFFGGDSPNVRKVYEPPCCMGSTISSFEHVVYNGERPWSQLCYFSIFKILNQLISVKEWLAQGLYMMVEAPLVFIDRNGRTRSLSTRTRKWRKEETVLWRKKDVYDKFNPRRLNVTDTSNRLATTIRTNLAAKKITSFLSSRKENKPMRYVKNGKITKEGKEVIRQWARKFPEASAETILPFLPKSIQKLPRRTIVAHIAVSRRGL